jgi:hypothetical protein
MNILVWNKNLQKYSVKPLNSADESIVKEALSTFYTYKKQSLKVLKDAYESGNPNYLDGCWGTAGIINEHLINAKDILAKYGLNMAIEPYIIYCD